MIKVADLPPDKNYILACYPHAVIPFGSYFNLCTSANNRDDLFPDIDICSTTLTMHFHAPVGREFLMAMGSFHEISHIIFSTGFQKYCSIYEG